MSLTMKCPCGKILAIAEPAHGKPAQCPSCGNVFIAGEPVRSTTMIQDGAPEVTATAPDSAPVPNGADEQSIALPWALPQGVYWIMIALVVTCGGLWGLNGFWPEFFRVDGGGGKKSTARIQVKGPMTTACKSYFDKNRRWPDDLKALTVKDANGIEYLESKDALFDPWGKEYQYDVKGPKNNGVRPDIWTVAPDGEIIGNWPKGR